MADPDDTFELWDLKVSVDEIRGQCTCGHAVGDSFELPVRPPGNSARPARQTAAAASE